MAESARHRGPKRVMRRGEKLRKGISVRDNCYRVRINLDGVQHECGLYDTKELAELALDKFRAEIILGTFIPPAERRRRVKAIKAREDALKTAMEEEALARALTVAQWSELWLEQLESAVPPRSPSTIASYRSSIRAHVLPVIGTKNLTDVTPEDVNECISKASRGGKSPGAGNNALRCLRSMFNVAVAVKAGDLTTSPVTATVGKTKTRVRDDDEVPSLDEVRLLAAAMPKDTQLAVLLAAWCSLRIGEVIGLQRGDFKKLDKPGEATVTISRQWLSKANPPAYGPPKDDSHRTVVVPTSLAKQVQAHLDNYVLQAADAPLFPSVRDRARPMSHNALTRRWNEARDEVRPGTDFHALRHFGLTAYAQAGATQTEIMRRGGHKDPDAAQRYQHSSIRRDQELTARLDAMMDSGEGK